MAAKSKALLKIASGNAVKYDKYTMKAIHMMDSMDTYLVRIPKKSNRPIMVSDMPE